MSSLPQIFTIFTRGYDLWREKLREQEDDHEPNPDAEVLRSHSTVDVRREARAFRAKQDKERAMRGKGPLSRKRDISGVTGVTVHQVAALLLNPARAARVHCHDMVMTDSTRTIVADIDDRLSAADGLNSSTISLEISCRAAGIEGNPKTLWRPKSKPNLTATEATDAQLEVACLTLADRVGEIHELRNRRGLKPIRVALYAHRQSDKYKISDPGSRIWMALLRFAVVELDMYAGKYTGRRKGKPIPEAWGGALDVPYSWRVKK